jgi:hypothetical protein
MLKLIFFPLQFFFKDLDFNAIISSALKYTQRDLSPVIYKMQIL